MTPLDLAQELGYQPLYNILSPVIRQTVPTKTLYALQKKFHYLIWNDLNHRQEHLYLPVLEVLTEMEVPQMWFPVKFHIHSPAVSFHTKFVSGWILIGSRVMYIALTAVNLWSDPTESRRLVPLKHIASQRRMSSLLMKPLYLVNCVHHYLVTLRDKSSSHIFAFRILINKPKKKVPVTFNKSHDATTHNLTQTVRKLLTRLQPVAQLTLETILVSGQSFG